MKTSELHNEISAYKEIIRQNKSENLTTRYKTVSLLNEVLRVLEKDIPKTPKILSDSGDEFECPSCGVVFLSEDGTYDDYIVCYICGQRFREMREGELDWDTE